jgi:hypothetical protein
MNVLRAALLGCALAVGFTGPLLADDDALDRARDLVNERKPREALALLTAIKGQENAPDFLALRGETYMDLGRFPEAKADLEKAQKDQAEAAYAKVHLAHIEFLYGRDDKAAALLKGAPEKSRLAKSLPVLMQGPFVAKWGPDGGRACRARSKDGHYLVYCDVGMDEAGATAIAEKAKPIRAKGGKDIEARLEKAAPTLESVKTVARVMDLIYKAYGAVFPLPKDEGIVHRVYVFSNREDFLALAKATGSDMSNANGFFDPETRILAVDARMRGRETDVNDDAVATLFHEAFHQFIHYYVPDMPSWFNEGLAEYFGPSQLVSKTELTVGVVKKKSKAGEQITRYERIKGSLDGTLQPGPLPLKQFLTMDSKGFAEGDRGRTNYAQAWSFIHFLLSSDKGKKLARAYFKALRDGKGEKAAFAETFGKENLDALDDEWKAYVKAL